MELHQRCGAYQIFQKYFRCFFFSRVQEPEILLFFSVPLITTPPRYMDTLLNKFTETEPVDIELNELSIGNWREVSKTGIYQRARRARYFFF